MGRSILSASAKTVPELRAVALALKALPRELRNDLNKSRRGVLNEMWRPAVAAEAKTNMDRLILAKGARVAPGNPAQAIAASSKRPLSPGGLVPDNRAQAAAFEFGSPIRSQEETYRRRNTKGAGTHEVTRHTRAQLPMLHRQGRVVYAAWAKVAPRIVSLDVQTIVRRIHEAYEGK